ncbi:MAG: FtsQ-type POTRA domain-containing protein [Candidatus Krumholzibacteriota bacterium]
MSRFAERRTPRRSRVGMVLRLALGFLVLAGVGLGFRWALTSSTFAVARVESGAYRFTSRAELEEAFSEFLGHNIWTLSTDEIAVRLETLPWVRDMRVRRSLPNTIEVDFREWRPLWQVSEIKGAHAGGLRPLVMIEDGRILEFPGHVVMAGLPVLVGVPAVREGGDGVLQVEKKHMKEIMELISAMEDAGIESVSPVDFVVARNEGYAIVLQDKRGILMVGREEFSDRLNRYMTARDYLDPGLEIDLRFKDRLTVKESPALVD